MPEFAKRMKNMEKSAAVIAGLFQNGTDPDIISFGIGAPAREALPIDLVREIAADVFTDGKRGAEALQYAKPQGLQDLREVVAEQLLAPKGVPARAEDILIVSGGMECMNLICQVFIDPGDTILVEAPTFVHSVETFDMFQANCAAVETDEDGSMLEDLEEKIRRLHPKMVYVVPTFQNPTGRQWSLPRRRAVLDIAQRYGLPILEDDPYGALRYEGEPLLSLKSMDSGGLVTYMGSFSKVLSPGIRLGWLLASRELIEKYTSAKECSDLQSSTIAQMTVDAYLESNDLDAHVSEITALYSQRRDRMLSALSDLFPAGTSWTHPQGGLFLWVTLPDWMDTASLLPEMVSRGVAYIPGRTSSPTGTNAAACG